MDIKRIEELRRAVVSLVMKSHVLYAKDLEECLNTIEKLQEKLPKTKAAEAEAIPTEPEQPTIGQQFYAKDGTLLETVVSRTSTPCRWCYYLPQKRDGGCPISIRCGPMTRDDKTGVYFPPVDTAAAEVDSKSKD